MNSSAHTVVSGVTVFDPMMLKEPDSSVGAAGAGVGACLAQPARTIVNASKTNSGNVNNFFDFLIFNFISPYYIFCFY
jgi:hypothetical protein